MASNSKFHISDGRVMPCNAKGVCPLGGNHFDSKDLAETYVQETSASEYGVLGGTEKLGIDSRLKLAEDNLKSKEEDLNDINKEIEIFNDHIKNAENVEDKRIASYELVRLRELKEETEARIEISKMIQNDIVQEKIESEDLENQSEVIANRFDRLEEVKESLGNEETLNALSKAMSGDDLRGAISSMADNHDLSVLIDENGDRYDNLNALTEVIGHEDVIHELSTYTSAKDLSESLQHIADTYDLHFSDDVSHWDNDSLYNTDNYQYEQDPYYAREELQYILDENTVKPRGEVVSYAMKVNRSSHYGSIAGNGQTGYIELRGGDSLVDGLMGVNTDTMTLTEQDGKLIASFHDHDGTHSGEVKPIVKSRYETFQNKLDMSSHEDILDYLDKVPSIKMKKKK